MPSLRPRLLLLTLAGSLAASTVVGRTERYWPIMTWAVYTTKDYGPPPRALVGWELEVERVDGTEALVELRHVLPEGQENIARRLLPAAAAEDAELAARSRRFIERVLRERLEGAPVARITALRTTWTVRPDRVPPFERGRPASRVAQAAWRPPLGEGAR